MTPVRAFLLCLFASVSAASAAPTVSSQTPPAGSIVSTLTTISVMFSEAVSGVDANDLLINTEAALTVSGSGAGPYLFTFTQPLPGQVSVAWDFDHGIAGVAVASGAFVPSPWTYSLTDLQPPAIGKIRTSVAGQEQDTIVPLPGSRVSTLTRAEVTFSESVTGVDAADLLVNGVSAAAVSGVGAGPYIFTFPQPAVGTVNFAWVAGHAIQDTAPIPNPFGGGGWTVTLSDIPETLVINEFLAANATSVSDENLSQEDWIEIYNPGSTPVNLLGWALSDDETQAATWTFPSRTIAAGGYLVVFASGKDRKPDTGNLHTNFKLNETGGYLALRSPDLPTIPSSAFAAYPPQRFDYTYGLQSGGGVRYFARPLPVTTTDTRPGSANGTSALVNITSKPSFSVARGTFRDPFQLVISCEDPGATVRYTLDGTEPTLASTVYASPLTVNGTTIIRAVAFATDTIPSATVTHSYVFLDQVLTQPSPPYSNAAAPNNPAVPNVGGVPFPISWGSLSGFSFPGQITNLATDQIPADYGVDPKILNDPNKYDDTGAVNNTTGKTNLERIKQGLRELPVLSVVMKTADMFGTGTNPPTGIYPNASESVKPDLTKPCSLELLLPDGSTGFAVTCGIDLHGNASRSPAKNPKHGFTLKFKGDYGGSKLEYPMFPDSPVKEFDKLVLRADFNSSWLHWDNTTQRPKGTRIRDAWCKDAFRSMGRPAGHHRYVHLFINGLYWGTYDPSEEESDDFAAAYYGGKKEDYEVVEQGVRKAGAPDTGRASDLPKTYNDMLAVTNLAVNSNYEAIKQYLDIPEFVDYMLLHFLVGHQDWGGDINKNWFAVRNAKNSGTYKYLPWDMENLLWDPADNRVTVTSPPSGLQTKLVANLQYKLDFADRVHKHMIAPEGALLPAANIGRLNKWTAIMNANEMACESMRWGDYRRDVHRYQTVGTVYTWNGKWFENNAVQTNASINWRAEINRLTGTYFPGRTTTVLSQLRSAGLYPTLNAPEIHDNLTNAILTSKRLNPGDQVKLTLASVTPAGTVTAGIIYYTTDGSDPRVYYTGGIGASAQAFTPGVSAPIPFNSSMTLKVRVLNGAASPAANVWSALNQATFTVGFQPSPVRITEIMYNSAGSIGGTAAEFIELQNTSDTPVEMSGWYFDGIDFVFPNGFVLGAGSRIVIASNNAPATFAAQYPSVTPVGYFGGNLDNGGERIALLDASGKAETVVEYDDAGGWPVQADGGGYSLEIVDPNGDANDPTNWKASAQLKGTPGLVNSVTGATGIEFSEVLAENTSVQVGGSVSDYVELHNTGDVAVDLVGWRLISPTAPTFTFPGGTQIPAGGYLIVVCAASGPGSLLRTGWSLEGGPTGGRVVLTNSAGVRVDGIGWRNQIANFSIGRVGGAWVLNNPTPGAANTAAATAPAAGNLVLNEWLADSPPGVSDWFELFNKHSTLPVALRGLSIQTSTQLYTIPTLSFIAPNGWLELFADEVAGANHVEFSLPATGTVLSILDTSGSVIDSVTFGLQVQGVSQGRQTDGAATIVSFGLNPTPGRSNALIAGYSGPTFNELEVINSTGVLAPWGARAGWVEFTNSGAATVDVSGMGFGPVQDPGSPSLFRFPAGTTVPAGGAIVVWLSTPPQGAVVPAGTYYVTQWSTNSTGGTLYLFDATSNGSNVLDALTYGNQIADFSIGRTAGVWKLLSAPTPGAANSGAAALGAISSVRINEWCAAVGTSAAINPFLELFNTAAQPVELSGCALTDDPAEPNLAKSPLPPLSFIAAGGWLKLDAVGQLASGFANIKLDTGGEYLRLSAPDLTQIDAVSFGLQVAGQSQGLFADGLALNQHLLPTPGFGNILLPAPAITQQPVSNTVAVAGTARFSVGASSTTPITYQWQFKGTDIEGATAQMLTLTNVSAAQEGDYTCAVSNPAGSKTTDAAHLLVVVPVTFAQWGADFGLSGANAAANADPDRDGLTNAQEYFHNLNPNVPNSTADRIGLPEIGFEKGTPSYVTLTYRRSAHAVPGIAQLQASTTLDGGSWSAVIPDATQTIGVDAATGDPIERVKVIVPSGQAKNFLRLQLTP